MGLADSVNMTGPQQKDSGNESLKWASVVDNVSHMLSQLTAGGIKYILPNSTGRGLLEAYTCFPLDFASWAFFLC